MCTKRKSTCHIFRCQTGSFLRLCLHLGAPDHKIATVLPVSLQITGRPGDSATSTWCDCRPKNRGKRANKIAIHLSPKSSSGTSFGRQAYHNSVCAILPRFVGNNYDKIATQFGLPLEVTGDCKGVLGFAVVQDCVQNRIDYPCNPGCLDVTRKLCCCTGQGLFLSTTYVFNEMWHPLWLLYQPPFFKIIFIQIISKARKEVLKCWQFVPKNVRNIFFHSEYQ